jgi:hypothetical protein
MGRLVDPDSGGVLVEGRGGALVTEPSTAGVFWRYFRDTLRLPFILVGGPLAMLAEGASGLLDAARSVCLSLRDQFFVETCEDVYIAQFARSRGIVRSPLEAADGYANRVRLAYLWHKRGGRAGQIAQTLADYFGFAGIEIVNLRAEDADRWAEFRVVIHSMGTATVYDEAQTAWAINEIKPARSKLDSIIPPAAPQVFRVGREGAGDKLLWWPTHIEV